MRLPLTYVELFAGAGGMSHGLELAGMTCVAHAEIDSHAQAVLRQHWPDTPLHGDVTQVDWTSYAGQVDLVSGGSPCQDLSVAGQRKGLAGEKSGLFFELIRAWEETRATTCLWENVDGARSSNNGRDFAAVLSAFVGADVTVPATGWRSSGVAAGPTGVAAWRVLDLQHFGPPQRRRRVFIVAARTGGVDPAEVLALSEGVCWHEAPSRTSWGWRSSDPIEGGAGDAQYFAKQQFGRYNGPIDIASTLGARDHAAQHTDLVVLPLGIVRRPTPKECERLMGWPDDWTKWGVKADGTRYAMSDTARYRMSGNGVGSPCAAWIGERLAKAIKNCPFT